ncbi:MAG: substrate-binding domain-containing protein [Bifidobacteriaceae bacterium]|jgi:ABC-type phosphate transport system substrate-binding protein|nr:substrate-binding domain-containing protein [Bifidobacteriaceae bacterium]
MKTHRRHLLGTLATIGAAAAVLGAPSVPALADPPGIHPPLAGVGSGTTQYVLDGLADSIQPSGSMIIGSYDSTGPLLIQTRAVGSAFNRPNGSTAGVRALTRSAVSDTWPQTTGESTTQVGIANQIDFARSSRPPSEYGDDLTYIPFAQDAVTYAYSDHGYASVPLYLTPEDLAAIYRGTVTTFVDRNGVLRTYDPALPPLGSDARQYFLEYIGVTETQASWILNVLPENDGSQIDGIGEIMPFSVGSWIAQDNNVEPNTVAYNDVQLGALDDYYWGVVLPVVDGAINPDFPARRLLFNVVQTSRLSGTSDLDVMLQNTFVGQQSYVCQSGSTITHYGFLTTPHCGNTTIFKSGYVY